MTRLRDVQRQFAAAVLGRGGAGVFDLIEDDGLSAERRLRIHANNTCSLLTDVLRGTFPAVCRLVGDPFFAHAAHEYVRADPPRQPCLHRYGSGFPGFLAAFEPAAELGYLPDVARLEWALNEAYYAPDAPPFPTDALRRLRPEQYAELRLRPHPSLRLVASPFPVDRIWRMARPDGDAGNVPALDAGPARLLVNRAGLDVGLTRLSEAAYRFGELLVRSGTAGEAYEGAAAVDPTFDLAAALGRYLAAGAFAGFEIGR